jgi:hypothetical protein
MLAPGKMPPISLESWLNHDRAMVLIDWARGRGGQTPHGTQQAVREAFARCVLAAPEIEGAQAGRIRGSRDSPARSKPLHPATSMTPLVYRHGEERVERHVDRRGSIG